MKAVLLCVCLALTSGSETDPPASPPLLDEAARIAQGWVRGAWEAGGVPMLITPATWTNPDIRNGFPEFTEKVTTGFSDIGEDAVNVVEKLLDFPQPLSNPATDDEGEPLAPENPFLWLTYLWMLWNNWAIALLDSVDEAFNEVDQSIDNVQDVFNAYGDAIEQPWRDAGQVVMDNRDTLITDYVRTPLDTATSGFESSMNNFEDKMTEPQYAAQAMDAIVTPVSDAFEWAGTGGNGFLPTYAASFYEYFEPSFVFLSETGAAIGDLGNEVTAMVNSYWKNFKSQIIVLWNRQIASYMNRAIAKFQPWVDLNNQLVDWGVEASSVQRNNADRIGELDPLENGKVNLDDTELLVADSVSEQERYNIEAGLFVDDPVQYVVDQIIYQLYHSYDDPYDSDDE